MESYNKVWFLGLSTERGGLLFPDEVDDYYYSPSVFILIVPIGMNFLPSYVFNVCDKSETYHTQLTRVEGNENLFSVRLKYGDYFFSTDKSPHLYVGDYQELFLNAELYILESIQPQALELLVQNHDTFFVGDTP